MGGCAKDPEFIDFGLCLADAEFETQPLLQIFWSAASCFEDFNLSNSGKDMEDSWRAGASFEHHEPQNGKRHGKLIECGGGRATQDDPDHGGILV